MSKEQDAATMYEERLQLDAEVRFTDESRMEGCCPDTTAAKTDALDTLHYKSFDHICNLLGADKEETRKIVREKMLADNFNFFCSEKSTFNPIDASSNEQNIALPDSNWLNGEVLTFVKEDSSNNPIKFFQPDGELLVTLSEPFSQTTLISMTVQGKKQFSTIENFSEMRRNRLLATKGNNNNG